MDPRNGPQLQAVPAGQKKITLVDNLDLIPEPGRVILAVGTFGIPINLDSIGVFLAHFGQAVQIATQRTVRVASPAEMPPTPPSAA